MFGGSAQRCRRKVPEAKGPGAPERLEMPVGAPARLRPSGGSRGRAVVHACRALQGLPLWLLAGGPPAVCWLPPETTLRAWRPPGLPATGSSECRGFSSCTLLPPAHRTQARLCVPTRLPSPVCSGPSGTTQVTPRGTRLLPERSERTGFEHFGRRPEEPGPACPFGGRPQPRAGAVGPSESTPPRHSGAEGSGCGARTIGNPGSKSGGSTAQLPPPTLPSGLRGRRDPQLPPFQSGSAWRRSPWLQPALQRAVSEQGALSTTFWVRELHRAPPGRCRV